MSGSPEKVYVQQDLSNIPVLNLNVEAVAVDPAPAAGNRGRVWFNTATGHFMGCDGAANFQLDVKTIPNGSVTSAAIADGTIVSADLAPNAGILKSQLAALGIVNADVAAGAGIVASKLDAVTLQAFINATPLSSLGAPTGPLSLNGQKIVTLADPTNPQDGATKNYVDLLLQGIKGVKDPVRVALSTNVNVASPGANLDAIAMAAGDGVLLTAQTTGTENGIYTWNGAAVPMTRRGDADATGEVVDGTLVSVADGSNAGKSFIQQAPPSGAPGTWSQTWTVFSSGGATYLAGTGLTLTGSTFSLNTVTVALGGTGATTAAGARANLAVPVKGAVVAVPALTAGVEATIAHGVGTGNAIMQCRRVADKSVVQIGLRADVTNVYVTADVAVAGGVLEVVYSPIDG